MLKEQHSHSLPLELVRGRRPRDSPWAMQGRSPPWIPLHSFVHPNKSVPESSLLGAAERPEPPAGPRGRFWGKWGSPGCGAHRADPDLRH